MKQKDNCKMSDKVVVFANPIVIERKDSTFMITNSDEARRYYTSAETDEEAWERIVSVFLYLYFEVRLWLRGNMTKTPSLVIEATDMMYRCDSNEFNNVFDVGMIYYEFRSTLNNAVMKYDNSKWLTIVDHVIRPSEVVRYQIVPRLVPAFPDSVTQTFVEIMEDALHHDILGIIAQGNYD